MPTKFPLFQAGRESTWNPSIENRNPSLDLDCEEEDPSKHVALAVYDGEETPVKGIDTESEAPRRIGCVIHDVRFALPNNDGSHNKGSSSDDVKSVEPKQVRFVENITIIGIDESNSTEQSQSSSTSNIADGNNPNAQRRGRQMGRFKSKRSPTPFNRNRIRSYDSEDDEADNLQSRYSVGKNIAKKQGVMDKDMEAGQPRRAVTFDERVIVIRMEEETTTHESSKPEDEKLKRVGKGPLQGTLTPFPRRKIDIYAYFSDEENDTNSENECFDNVEQLKSLGRQWDGPNMERSDMGSRVTSTMTVDTSSRDEKSNEMGKRKGSSAEKEIETVCRSNSKGTTIPSLDRDDSQETSGCYQFGKVERSTQTTCKYEAEMTNIAGHAEKKQALTKTEVIANANVKGAEEIGTNEDGDVGEVGHQHPRTDPIATESETVEKDWVKVVKGWGLGFMQGIIVGVLAAAVEYLVPSRN